MISIRHYLLGTLLVLLLAACDGDSSSGNLIREGITPTYSSPSSSSYAFDENEKSYLYDLFLTEYYWNDQVPLDFDYTNYAEPQPMIDTLKYGEIDQWSFALTRQQYDDLTTQNTSGFGFGFLADFTVYIVRIASPAESAGLLRGDKILSINGQPPTDLLIAQTSQNVNQSTQFTVDRLGTPVDLTITAQYYNYSVASASVVQTPAGKQVGYLRFDAFTESATQELERAFTYLKAQNIDKLVVDLRYNGGGSVNTASILLDKLGGNFNGKLQFTLTWNEQSSAQNESLYFDSLDPNSLSLSKLIFLTTGESASASELVINAMRPYMSENTLTVGEATHGKPVGMAGRTDGSYIYYLVNFVVDNAVGFHDYFNGLPAECYVKDNDFSHQLGDPNEALLQEALHYIDNNHC